MSKTTRTGTIPPQRIIIKANLYRKGANYVRRPKGITKE